MELHQHASAARHTCIDYVMAWAAFAVPLFIDEGAGHCGALSASPDKALVLCVDEKAQMQALDRSQPLLPLPMEPQPGADPQLVACAAYPRTPQW